MPPGSRVALYGLSANPPTSEGGHACIVRHLADDGGFDEVWVLPVYRHAYASKSNLAPFEHRVKMCELAFDAREPEAEAGAAGASSGTREGGRVRVLDVERVVATAACEAASRDGTRVEDVRVGSFDVLGALAAANPGVAFAWCLGADAYGDLRAGKWWGRRGGGADERVSPRARPWSPTRRLTDSLPPSGALVVSRPSPAPPTVLAASTAIPFHSLVARGERAGKPGTLRRGVAARRFRRRASCSWCREVGPGWSSSVRERRRLKWRG